MSKTKLILLILLALVIFGSFSFYFKFVQKRTKVPFFDKSIQTVAVTDAKKAPRLEVLASNLEIPWALAFLPDRSILFTERTGQVRLINNKGDFNENPIAVIDDVLAQGEGGLMGIAVHPNFTLNHFVYLYYTYANNNGQTLNRVVRFKFEDGEFLKNQTIVDEIPGNIFHNGGRIKFGPDNYLYITTGDSQNPSLSQDKNSLAGKILRVKDDGSIPSDNPFGTTIWSYGHRNPQGLDWDTNDRLWATEHGPSTLDELNIIDKGKNYGWPIITGEETQSKMETPIINSDSDTWAPSGTAYLDNSIFFAGLRGQALYQAVINGNNVNLSTHLKGELGRIREVVAGPDNLLYITTSNHDGRGFPDGTDDKIIRVNPDKL